MREFEIERQFQIKIDIIRVSIILKLIRVKDVLKR